MRNIKVGMLVVSLLIFAGCSPSNQPTTSTNANAGSAPSVPPTAAPTTAAKVQKTTKATGALTATPNPIKVCDGTGLGVTKLSWSAAGTYLVEVRIGAPDGGVFARTPAAGGSQETGKWAGKGSTFYLQDVANGKPLTAENTIATLAVNSTTEGCP